MLLLCGLEAFEQLQGAGVGDRDPKTEWGDEQDEAIKAIKDHFTSPAILRHYDPSLRTILQTDASDYMPWVRSYHK